MENQGADIGPFLRQLQVLGGERPWVAEFLSDPEDPQQEQHSRPQAVQSPEVFDTFLKIHTKGGDVKRRSWLEDLCGDVRSAQQVYNKFKMFKSLGMVGASSQVFSFSDDVRKKHKGRSMYQHFHFEDLCAIKRTWIMMQPCVPFDIPLSSLRIIAGSFYWARPDAVLHQIVLHSAEKLIRSMPSRYRIGSRAETSHALEHLMPMMATAVRGLDVVSVNESWLLGRTWNSTNIWDWNVKRIDSKREKSQRGRWKAMAPWCDQCNVSRDACWAPWVPT